MFRRLNEGVEKMDRIKAGKWLAQYIGIREGSASHNNIIKIYNTQGGNHRYTMTNKDAWCATAVSAAFIAVGYKSIFPCIECSCNEMIRLAKKNNIWVEDDSYNAEVGDVILYSWSDGGSGDCVDSANHVGIITNNDGKNFTVIEGNKNDTVGYRTIAINGRYIRGFITPRYIENSEEKTEMKTTYYAKSFDSSIAGKYITTESLNLRTRPDRDAIVYIVIPKGHKVQCYGYHTKKDIDWYLVQTIINNITYEGYCSSKYLRLDV